MSTKGRNLEAVPSPALPDRRHSAGEVLRIFVRLGLTSFGGPIAHIGYFRREFVERRQWLSDAQFAQLLALCQFLPGPASSQMGFSIGLLRAGWLGALAAFFAFTVPSALLMFAFAIALPALGGTLGEAALHGLKLVALAVVAHGVLGMARQLCPDRARATIGALAAVAMLLSGLAWLQLVVIAAGAIAGMLVCRDVKALPGSELRARHGAGAGWLLIGAFVLLLFTLPLFAGDSLSRLAAIFYRAGALVFGGGHVVLPLLEEALVAPGLISHDAFLAGYGAAQAVPGPMFTIAAYLGARVAGPEQAIAGASVALLAIFLPGFLLVAGALPLWRAITAHPMAVRAVAGVNAAVVGLLAAALYAPVWVSAVRAPIDLAIALIAFVLLVAWRVSALVIVLWCVAASMASAMLP